MAMLGSIGFKTGFNSGAAAQPEEIEHIEKSVAETREKKTNFLQLRLMVSSDFIGNSHSI